MSKLTVYKKRVQSGQLGGCSHPKCIALKNLTVDHIIPRVFLKCLGMEALAETDEDNFQVLCKNHNGLKGNELDYTNPKTLPLLKKYINIWMEKHGDYFIPPEKRVYKIPVMCDDKPWVFMHRNPNVPEHLDVQFWNNPPKFARTYPYGDLD